MAQIADNNGDPGFTNKLQKLLHGCGKQTLNYLDISSKPPDKPINKIADPAGGRGFFNKFRNYGKQTLQYFGISSKQDKPTQKPKIPECRAILTVSPDGKGWVTHMFQLEELSAHHTYKECEFPETGMPENINTFKLLSIRHLDDQVLSFLEKIKPLFTNVLLDLGLLSVEPAENLRILFGHLLPMLESIRGIRCDNDGFAFLEQHFPGTLALANELELLNAGPASIPSCLNWLNAPQDFGLDGPKFLVTIAKSEHIFAIIDAQFLIATNASTFVIFLQFFYDERHNRAKELTIQNAATKEQLTIKNAIFKRQNGKNIHYVEIMRHPAGADAQMQEWIKERDYFETKYKNNETDGDENQVMFIYKPTIGRIKKQLGGMDQDEEEPADDAEAGPSNN